MANHNESSKENASAIGGSLDPQDGQRTLANASRLVKRDKRPTEPPQTNTGLAFSTEQTERVTLHAGRNNVGTILFHPIPDEAASVTVAHVDWLGLTLRLPDGKGIHWLFEQLQSVFGLSVTKIKAAGWNGYDRRAEMGKYGLVAWGGKAQRGTAHVEVNGMGCAQIVDWAKVESWGVRHHARITRIDLAHDDLEGAQCNIDRTLEWHDSGGFNCGGRNAKVELAGDWHDLTDGRTIYIGTRGNQFM